MALTFRKAEKSKAKLRLALIGPAGSGKSYTALVLATSLAEGKPIAVIDTEHGSASLYADLFPFDVLELDSFAPQTYVEAIHAAEHAGYGVIVIDSLSHAWEGKGGALDQKEAAEKRQSTRNSYTAWRDVTPIHNALVDAMLQSPAHVIGTVRSRTEYVQEKDGNGKTVIRKVGMKPVQRDGLEYEFTIVGDLDWEHNLIISKTRMPALADQVIGRPGPTLGAAMLAWLNAGVDEAPAAALAPTADGTTPTPIRPPAHPRDLYQDGPPNTTRTPSKASEPHMQQAAVIASMSAPPVKQPARISDAQRRMLFGPAASSLGWGEDEIRAAVGARFGLDHIHELTVPQATELIDAMRAGEYAAKVAPVAVDPLPLEPCPGCGVPDQWVEGGCGACGWPATESGAEQVGAEQPEPALAATRRVTDPADVRNTGARR